MVELMQAEDARRIAQTFDPDRLRIARQAVGLLKRELAEQVDVTAAAISQYEGGKTRPSPGTLVHVAQQLGYPVEFFASDRPVEEAEAGGGFFRKLSRAPTRQRRQAVVLPLLLRDLVDTVERHVRLPEVDIPRLGAEATTTPAEVEDIARRVRKEWQTPSGPVSHLVRLLESHGIVVVRLQAGSTALDAFSRWFPDHPVVVLYSDKGDASRSRFDAAHELGHLVMHRSAPHDADWVEEQANWFAASFLMPADDIRQELPCTISWVELIRLKLRWGTSIAALLRRARTLGCLDQQRYESAMKALSVRGWRKNEPGQLGKPEAPILLERAVALLEDEGISVEMLAHESRLPATEVHRWLEAASDPRPPIRLDLY
jgi:Zn-dependent peptidase ImmA (M78 family)/transcriptional regulator with XRE-family HTH domain